MASCLVVGWLSESFLFHAVLYIEAVGTTTLVTHKKFSLAIIQTDARNVSVGDVSEYVLQASIRSVPDLDASWMSGDESVENRVVQHTEASIFVSEMMVNRFVIVVKHQRSASHYDSLRRCCHSKRIDLIETAVKSLCSGVGSHVPDSNHARNVGRNDGLSVFDPLDADQTMVVTFHQEDAALHLRVPKVNVVIQASGKNHVHVGIPV